MNLACQSIKNFLLFWLRNSNPSEDVNPEVKVFLEEVHFMKLSWLAAWADEPVLQYNITSDIISMLFVDRA